MKSAIIYILNPVGTFYSAARDQTWLRPISTPTYNPSPSSSLQVSSDFPSFPSRLLLYQFRTTSPSFHHRTAILHSKFGDSPQHFTCNCDRPNPSQRTATAPSSGVQIHPSEQRFPTGPASTMKKAGHGKAPRKSRGARKKNYIKEDSLNVSEEAEQSVVEEELVSTSIENLPEELLINIFIRLLAKQLAKMRAVSKSWNDLLSESSFVKSHLHESIHRSELMLLAMNYDICSCNSEQYTVHTNPSPELRPNSPVNPQFNRMKVIGAVTGLVCVSSDYDSIIWITNFSLSAVSRLPPFLIPDSTTSQIFLRFGFDPQSDDYKVVKLTGIMSMKKLSSAVGRIQFPCCIEKWLKVEVYSMRKGSWEIITGSLPSRVKMLIDSDLLCVDGHDGHLHWVGWCSRGGKTYFDTIVSFDLSSHTFREIPFPDASTLNHHDYVSRIGVLSGKLCLILEGDGSAYEVWVMDESWVKRHVLSLSSFSDVYPFGFTSQTDEFLVRHGGDLVLWDLCANKHNYFDKFCCGKRHHPSKIVGYVDSLVWVTPDKTEIEGA